MPGLPGTPRRSRVFNQRMAFPLVVSAVVPLFLSPGGAYPVLAAVVFIASWLVFLVDLVVHERRLVHYLGTWLGRFDLVVVVLTAPWFLITGTSTGKFVILIRLARVARVVMATRGARRLFERLGAVALVAVGVVIVGAAVGYRAEHATEPRVQDLRRRALVGDRDLDHGGVRRRRAQDNRWSCRRSHDHGYGSCSARRPRGVPGKFLWPWHGHVGQSTNTGCGRNQTTRRGRDAGRWTPSPGRAPRRRSGATGSASRWRNWPITPTRPGLR